MRFYLPALFFYFLLPYTVTAQEDYLLMKNGDMYWVKTISRKGRYITYSIPYDGNTTIYFARKNEVKKWVSGNVIARREHRHQVHEQHKHPDSTITEYNRNFLGLDAATFYDNTVQVHFTHVFKEGKWGMNFNAAFNYKADKLFADYGRVPLNGYSYNKRFASYLLTYGGTELRYYTNFKRRFCFHFGQSVAGGVTRFVKLKEGLPGSEELSDYLNGLHPPQEEWLDKYNTGVFVSSQLNGGILWRPATTIYADLNIGGGAGAWVIPGFQSPLKSVSTVNLVIGWHF